jgi:transcriptional regulator GlxA family with amidase domain
MASPATLRWIAECAAGAQLVASVCTGVFLLAKSGVVTQEAVTTHWEDIADLREQFPSLDVREGERWIDSGRVVSSAGISAGIDMSLYLVERLAGRALAERTARQMDYAWISSNSSPSA